MREVYLITLRIHKPIYRSFSIEVSGISSRAYRTGTSNEHTLPWFEVRSLYRVISDSEGFHAGPNLHW